MKALLTLPLLVVLGGCAGNPVLLSNYCQLAQPIKVSRLDTRATKEQADREYRKYVAACGLPPT